MKTKKTKLSPTRQAIALAASKNISYADAVKLVNYSLLATGNTTSESAVSRALKMDKTRVVCPDCGHVHHCKK